MNRLKRWKRNCCLIVLAGLLLLILLCAGLAILVSQAKAQDTARPPLDVLLLIDHSNSMWDKGGVGSDPDLLRVQAAQLFIAYLGTDTAQAGDRLGVIHFGGESILVAPLTSLDSKAQRRAIQTAIATPQRMGWTDPLKALELAHDTLFPQGRRDPARQPVVILLSDGKPELSPAPPPEEQAAYLANLRKLVDRFREQGCPIFAVALSNEATDADPDIQTVYRNLWQEIAARTPPAEYHEARTAGDLPHIYHAIVASLAGAEAGDPIIDTIVEGQATHSIDVEPGLARVTLVVLHSDPRLEMHLVRPGGTPARPGDPDVSHAGGPGPTREEIWTIANPRPGRWTLELQGYGTVLAWRDTVPEPDTRVPAYAIAMAEMESYVPAGQSLEITAIIVQDAATGETVVDGDVQVTAQVHRAGFAEATLLARDDGRGCDAGHGDGRYCLVVPDPPPGACTLRLRALLDGTEIARREVAFDAIPLPRLEMVSPRAGTLVEPGAELAVSVRIWSDRRVLGEKEISALETLTASLHTSGGETRAISLAGAGEHFAGRATVPSIPGPLTLSVRLRGQTDEGLPFEDVAHVRLDVAAPPVAAPETHPRPAAAPHGSGWLLSLAGLAALAVAGGAGGLLARWRKNRTTLDGSLRVLSAPSDQSPGAVFDLPAAPRAVIGGTGKRAIQLPGEVPPVTLHATRTPEGEAETWIAPPSRSRSSEVTLNEHPLETPRRMRDGDVLALGDYRLRFESLHQASIQRARHRPRRKMHWNGGVR